jgi:hypothetical protein
MPDSGSSPFRSSPRLPDSLISAAVPSGHGSIITYVAPPHIDRMTYSPLRTSTHPASKRRRRRPTPQWNGNGDCGSSGRSRSHPFATRHGAEVNETDAVPEVVNELSSGLQRQSGLHGATRSGQRLHARRTKARLGGGGSSARPWNGTALAESLLGPSDQKVESAEGADRTETSAGGRVRAG